MDRWTQIELFVLTSELGSLSKAAEQLGMSNAAASRTLSALEERLGARLIERTTRRQWLTDAGQAYKRSCVAVLSEMAEAEAAASEATLRPSGVLRVTSSVSFATLHIAPFLTEFNRRYPNISVQVIAANRYPDFIEAGIDIAIRTREHEGDSGITVRKLADTNRILAASPAYLTEYGRPSRPEDLNQHRMLVYNLAVDPYVLHFRRGEETCDVPITSVLDSNEGQVIVAAGRAGLGIAIQPLYIIHDDVVAGRLVPILEDWQLPRLTINLAYQSRRYQPAKIRVFTEFLIEWTERRQLAAKWRAIR
ncbi:MULTISPECIES: LysR family transcriptional regulator [Burkholderia]|uniref:LysR family transcriptional regulator n=1 Tax=Burkholderia TaxID=32008 RepID=UPI000BF79F65|nr:MULTISPECIES: LysR family transcriptional regulator [Burkholderia]PFH12751.1 LysR family transcriptional regulator [Burkholderia sp. JKS000303]RQZ31641.1 LysR family transcriptional regulator [Burkholderia sp. Bp9017]RQZ37772.1 LysR family transcriptional regulator [Burkholderia sp. Bp9016]